MIPRKERSCVKFFGVGTTPAGFFSRGGPVIFTYSYGVFVRG